jgi:hypothetical protein
VLLLTNLAACGHTFNPISVYYVFEGLQLINIVAEVTNIPWHEKTTYILHIEAGSRISTVLTATVLGMARGGWMSGIIYDWTGSYTMAFLNGVAWNVLNLGIALWILYVRRPHAPPLSPAMA